MSTTTLTPASPALSAASTTVLTDLGKVRVVSQWPGRRDDFPNLLTPEFATLKATIREQYGDEQIKKSWIEVCDRLNNVIIPKLRKLGSDAIPSFTFEQMVSASDEEKRLVKEAGCVLVRGVIDSSLASQWQTMSKEYIKENRSLVSGIPRNKDWDEKSVWDVFWSPAQIAARGHTNMLKIQSVMNSLWFDSDPEDPEPVRLDEPYSYADRVRLREPGDSNFSLGPHIDGGSLERWQDEQYRSVYDLVFSGQFDKFQNYDVRKRLTANQNLYGGTAGCRVLRTFQGWTSLSSTGPGEGSLSLFPAINESIAYILLRPFFSPPMQGQKLASSWEDPRTWTMDTTSAFPGSVGAKSQELGFISHPHLRLKECAVPLPRVEPGDQVFWHCDGIHVVDAVQNGTETAAVFYIGSVPGCQKNDEFLAMQAEHFKAGWAPPDHRWCENDGEARFAGFLGERYEMSAEARRAMAL